MSRKLDAEHKRTRDICIALTDAEFALLEAAAVRARKPRSTVAYEMICAALGSARVRNAKPAGTSTPASVGPSTGPGSGRR